MNDALALEALLGTEDCRQLLRLQALHSPDVENVPRFFVVNRRTQDLASKTTSQRSFLWQNRLALGSYLRTKAAAATYSEWPFCSTVAICLFFLPVAFVVSPVSGG